MKRARAVSAGTLSRLFQQAADAWRRQDYPQTIDLLERASRLDPANGNVLFHLGRAHGLRYDCASAERSLEKAIRLSSRRDEALAAAARRCQEFGHYAMAVAYLERAVRESPASADSLVLLAELYERGHRLEEAQDLIERALQTQAMHSRALLGRVRLLRLRDELEGAENCVRALMAGGSCDAGVRIRAGYELGGILDRQRRFDEAMEAFLDAKALQRPAAGPAAAILAGVQARVKELQLTVTGDLLDSWQAPGGVPAPARPLAILCGHPRSGTTLIEQVLGASSHTEAVSPGNVFFRVATQ